MGFSDERIVNSAAVSATLRCPICTEVFDDPVYSGGHPCQHVYCRSCIGQALQRRRQCPTCRAPLRQQNLQPHAIIRSLLDELQVRCEARQCSWTGRQDSYTAHLQECPVKLLEATQAKLKESEEVVAQQGKQLDDCYAQIAERDQQILDMSRVRYDYERKDKEIRRLQTEMSLLKHSMETEVRAQVAEAEAHAATRKAHEAQAAAQAAVERARSLRQRSCEQKDTRENINRDMQVFIRWFSGKSRVLQVKPHETIGDLKASLQQHENAPLDVFYIVYQGKPLADEKSLFDYGISRDATLEVRLRQPSRRVRPEGPPPAKARRT
eukprot:TRINITY_DN59445_c0_g1_i1.p1 TRINITY_DN59445_c0_g1~~TRINITY_DN59445_c0_g1_i1.p1  ORF type:complete len:324 (+),score=41.61 TRINITY_DN59445_c0_g1_i1:80-1051(+)